MVKIAVIFVLIALFALCSVVMSARITLEEPNDSQPFFNKIRDFAKPTYLEEQAPWPLRRPNNCCRHGIIKELVETVQKNFEDPTNAKKH